MGKSSTIQAGVLHYDNPYPGIRPFSGAEDRCFFGREKEVADLSAMLEKRRFLSVFGASGSGKTSLISSGLIPALIEKSDKGLVPIRITPGQHPLERLIRGLMQVFPRKIYEADVQAYVSGGGSLIDVLLEKGLGSHNYLLVVDQFEELFRQGAMGQSNIQSKDAARFVREIQSLLRENRLQISIVIAIRSDFRNDCRVYKGLYKLIEEAGYVLPSMDKKALRSVVRGPVEQAGGILEEGFEDLILDELGDAEHFLPLLQFALMRTWDYWKQRGKAGLPVSRADYEAIGPVRSAVSRAMEEAYESLDKQGKLICEKLFKALTAKSEAHAGYKRGATLGTLAKIAQVDLETMTDVVEAFRKRGRSFLIPGAEIRLHAESWIELSHEALIPLWDRLHTWVEEEYASVRIYLKLSEASALYQQGRAELLNNAELQQALEWRNTHNPGSAWGVQYDTAFERAMVFLKTSEDQYVWEEEQEDFLKRRNALLKKGVIYGVGAVVLLFAFLFIFGSRGDGGDEPSVNADPVVKQAPAYTEDPQAIAPGDTEDPEVNESGQVLDQGLSGAASQGESASTIQRNPLADHTAPAVTRPVPEDVQPAEAALNADRQAVLDLAKSAAVQSQGIERNPDLQGLLAYQSYLLNQEYKGNTYDRDIYLGLYAAMKKLVSPAYNIYPNLRHSIKDICWLRRTGSLLVVSGDGSVKILAGNVANRASQIDLDNTGQSNECLAVSPDEKLAVVGTSGGGLLFLELENKGRIVDARKDNGATVLFVRNLGNSGAFITAGTENKIMRWDYASHSAEVLLNTPARPSALAVSLNGKKVAYATRDGKVYEFDASNPDQATEIADFGNNQAWSLEYSPGGQYLAAGLRDGKVSVMQGNGRKVLANLEGPKARVTGLAYSSDGLFLVAGSHDGNTYLWNTKNLEARPLVFEENNGFVLAVCFSPDGRYFYSGSVDFPRMVGRPSSAAIMVGDFCALLGRNLTPEEWRTYFGAGLPYRKTCNGLN